MPIQSGAKTEPKWPRIIHACIKSQKQASKRHNKTMQTQPKHSQQPTNPSTMTSTPQFTVHCMQAPRHHNSYKYTKTHTQKSVRTDKNDKLTKYACIQVRKG